MASLVLSAMGLHPRQSLVKVSNNKSVRNKKEGWYLRKTFFDSKRDRTRDHLMISNVASHQSPASVPERESCADHRNHAAWTSVKQERWEGELVVEGEIPSWLVRVTYKFPLFLAFL